MVAENRQESALRILDELPTIYFNAALDLIRDRQLNPARDKLLAALALAPGMVDGHVVLGKVYAQLGQYHQAIGCWQRALELHPENAAALAAIAKARELMRKQASGATFRHLITVLVVAAIFLAGFSVTYLQRSISGRSEPSAVERIEGALENNPLLGGLKFKAVKQGDSIRLLGTVETPLQRETAHALASAALGGQMVDISQLQVAHPDPIAESVNNLLRLSPDAAFQKVSATESNGTVYLAGAVPSDESKQWLVGMAQALIGVHRVEAGDLRVASSGEYLVRPGDTLWDLARRFYGSGLEWVRIANANPLVRKDPDHIPVGMRLSMPPEDQSRTGGE
jgi:tetratricopeptide (TPR) repeat protein